MTNESNGPFVMWGNLSYQFILLYFLEMKPAIANLKTREIERQEFDFISTQRNLSQFLQSSHWQKVEELDGCPTQIIKAVDNDERTLAAGLFVQKRLFGRKYYWYCPRGPLVVEEDIKHGAMRSIREYFSQDPDCIFLRIEPTVEFHEARSVKEIQPAHTLVINLKDSQEKILASMHSKTRYNINLAERKKIKVIDVVSEESLKVFWQLTKETSGRQGINLHQFEHYHHLWDSFNEYFHLLIAYHGDKPLAAGLFVNWGDTFTYLHGASTNDNRELMAPYLIQWEGIKLGKKLSCKYYDFYGVAPDYHGPSAVEFNKFVYSTSHPWAGVSRFKFGFGGERIDFLGTFDLILDPIWYKLYQILRFINLTFRKIWKVKA